jgi:hypothetical protein
VALRHLNELLDRRARIDRTCRVVGAVDDEELGARRDQVGEGVEVGLKAVGRTAGVEDALGVGPGQHHPEVGPAGVGEQHFVAVLEHRREDSGDCADATGGAGDAIGRDVDAVHARELGDELLAKGEEALGVRVVGLALVDGALAGFADVVGRPEVGLPDVEAYRARRAYCLIGDLANAGVVTLSRAVREWRQRESGHE